jgi:inner membrane protein involved in colicin E2 resistance
VSLPGDVGDTSSAWSETIVGAIFLLLFPVSMLLAIIGRRRRRRRAIRSALGE